jgi:transposase
MNIMTGSQTGQAQFIGRFLTEFQRKLLQKSLLEELSEHYRQRLLIMLLADEGKTQSEICRTLNCCPTTARHWIFMAKMGMAHQWQEQPIGRPQATNHQYRERLRELVGQNPRNYGYAFQRWTGYWLSRHLAKELKIEVNERQVNRILNQMGLSTRNQGVAAPADQASVKTRENSPAPRILIQDLSFLSESNSAPASVIRNMP